MERVHANTLGSASAELLVPDQKCDDSFKLGEEGACDVAARLLCVEDCGVGQIGLGLGV